MAYGLSNGRLDRNISKTTWARGFKFGMQLCIGNAERAHK